MYKGFGLFLTITLSMAAFEAPRVVGALSRLEFFRVTEVTVQGGTSLTAPEIVSAAAIPDGMSVLDDLKPLVARLESHPLIVEAHASRRLPSGLALEIAERQPIALVPDPVLTPVDREAEMLPIDPAGRRLDLPIVLGLGTSEGGDEALTEDELRTLTSELGHLDDLDPSVFALVSEVGLDSSGDVLLRLDRPHVTLRYRPPIAADRLNEGLQVLADALERQPGRDLVSVDLRFSDQVVVRFLDSDRG